MDMTHKQYANSLRQIADFFEEHAEIPLPHDAGEFGYFSGHSKQDMTTLARALGGKVNKKYTDWSFELTRQFGSILFRAVANRDRVCRAVVKGQKTVKTKVPATYVEVEHVVDDIEWVCDESLLEPEARG